MSLPVSLCTTRSARSRSLILVRVSRLARLGQLGACDDLFAGSHGAALLESAMPATLREGAAAVARDLVCPTCLTDYIHETLRTLREQFRSDLALDSRDSMRRSLVGVNCTRLGLTELKLDPHHGLSVVAAPLPAVD